MVDFPGAIEYYVDRSRVFQNQNSHRAIVCHGTGGSASQTVEQLGDWFRSNSAITSVHYGIGRDGRIAQYVREQDGAAGNCCVNGNYDPFWDQFGGDNLNVHTLSFETINDSTNSLPLTDPQKQTMFKLIKYWVDKYKIPVRNIKSHASIDAVNRQRCPGPNFPWDELWQYLGGNMNVPQGWTDDGKTLTAPNGTIVTLGFREYVLSHGWDPNNWPLEVENHQSVLEQSNTSLGAGQSQMFRKTRLEYNEKMGVFEGWLGQELLWYTQQYPQLQKQVVDLNTTIDKLQSDISTLQSENGKLKALLASSNLGQIESLGKQIQDDVSLILKLVQVH